MNLALFNVKYAPNLGDGLLSECLEEAIHSCGDHSCTSVDLAGRVLRDNNSIIRVNRLRLLTNIPESLRPWIARIPLMVFEHLKWTPHYRKSLEHKDAIVIGGGNLLTDLDLNFPTKISSVLDLAAEQDIPVAIFGCGVGNKWSRKGLKLIRNALSQNRIIKVGLRDANSKKNWDEHFGAYVKVQSEIVWDPAILSSRFKPEMPDNTASNAVGLEITGYLALRYHSDFSYSENELTEWYLSVISEITKSDFQPVVFTNGSPEDIYFLNFIKTKIDNRFGGAVRLVQPTTPDELCHLLAGLKGVIAHRLHAIIPTYSYGVPFIAMAWDPKLTAFLNRIGLPHRLVEAVEFPAQQIVTKLFDMHQDTASEVLEKQEEALRQVEYLVRALEQAVSEKQKIPKNGLAKRTVYINGRFLTQPITGVQRFAQEIVLGLDKILSMQSLPVEFVLLMPQNAAINLRLKTIQVWKIGRSRGHFWEQVVLFWATRGSFLLNFGSSGPVLKRKQLTVIHDAAVHRIPENYSYLYTLVHSCLDHLLARRSRIGTVSEFSRRELSQILGIKPEKIDVFANGHEHILNIQPDKTVFEKLKLDDRSYLLFIGSPTPNKNLSRAIQAFEKVQPKNTVFVIVGAAQKSVYQSAENASSQNIIFAGRLTDEEIIALYYRAIALVFPSLYEGFGIPPLEAMAHGCPVIASRIPAIEEVCGDAVLYFNPLDISDIAGRMSEVVGNAQLRQQLIEKGQNKIRNYSWQTSAEKILNLIKREIQSEAEKN